MKQITRCAFCNKGISAAMGLGIPGTFSSCNKKETNVPPSDLPPSDGITARVAAITGDDLQEMTRNALDAIGDMPSIVHEGETVVIKPNPVSIPWTQYNYCFLSGECTKPEIIMVVEECLKPGATSARIMDHNVEYIKQLSMGYDMGLGEIREASIEVAGENLENLKSKWKPARLQG